MTITQTVEIPTDYRISFELPHSVPAGVMAKVEISILAEPVFYTPAEINEIRQLLQKEMAEKGTLGTTEMSGAGWEAHVRERHGKP